MQSKKTYNPEIHHRRSIRLKGYDYSQEGLYFVTICVHDRECLLGEVKNGEMILNEYGKMVEYTWHDLPNHNPNIQLGAYCTMPNHVHGIIEIIPVGADSQSAQIYPDSGKIKREDSDSANIKKAGLEPAPTNLSEIIRQFKTFSARRINKTRETPGISVWQRNYYEHIIRHQQAYENITNYIETNPTRWDNDKFHNL
jgi:REP element-mobilizing transposase RayT